MDRIRRREGRREYEGQRKQAGEDRGQLIEAKKTDSKYGFYVEEEGRKYLM